MVIRNAMEAMNETSEAATSSPIPARERFLYLVASSESLKT
eukprot:COSAG06_NODE_56830_length_283_cov_0.538043_1_plen_40_part_10